MKINVKTKKIKTIAILIKKNILDMNNNYVFIQKN